MTTLTPESLIERVARRDAAAFEQLYDQMAPRALGLLLTITSNRADAEEVLQEAMWEVWQRAAGYDPALASVAGWILMIVRSRGVDRVRMRKRDQARIVAAADSMKRPGPDPTDRESASIARDRLGELPQSERAAIMLAYQHGLTREQIAQALGVPVGTVKTWIRAGIGRLREALLGAGEAST